MSKTKLITKRKCPAGETYVFKNGVAEVPGMRHTNCGYNMWYCAYQEDMMIDLKEMNT